MDDIVVTESHQALINTVLNCLAILFSIKDLCDLHFFLGIEVTRTTKGLHLMQLKYILDLLAKTKMTNAIPVTLTLSPKLTMRSGTPLVDMCEYRQVIGSLQYLAFTRPDIAYAINKLSQFMHSPTDEHWQAVERILRYLAGAPFHGIFFKYDNPLTLHAYSDWAGDLDDFVL